MSDKCTQDKIADHTLAILEIRKNCCHVIERVGDTAFCTECSKNFGWWCEKSPNNLCRYEDDDGLFNEEDYDCCIYCGKPYNRD